jgi:hypothetical protein
MRTTPMMMKNLLMVNKRNTRMQNPMMQNIPVDYSHSFGKKESKIVVSFSVSISQKHARRRKFRRDRHYLPFPPCTIAGWGAHVR